MIEIGKTCRLKIAREAEPGLYLTDGEAEVLLPNKFRPHKPSPDEELEVFVYTDSEDRPVATTQVPLISVGGFANLKCVASGTVGAFMNWGLDKDLLVPHREQQEPFTGGKSYVITARLDHHTGRVYGSSKLSKFFEAAPLAMRTGDPIQVLAYSRTDTGVLIVAENKYGGIVHNEDGGDSMDIGLKATGWIKRVREDGRIAVTAIREGFRAAIEDAPKILDRLREKGGYLPYGDRTDPHEIRNVFGMSKASFKKAIGTLMKSGQISIEPHGIRIVKG